MKQLLTRKSAVLLYTTLHVHFMQSLSSAKKIVIAELEIPQKEVSLWRIQWLCCRGDAVSTQQPLAIRTDGPEPDH